MCYYLFFNFSPVRKICLRRTKTCLLLRVVSGKLHIDDVPYKTIIAVNQAVATTKTEIGNYTKNSFEIA